MCKVLNLVVLGISLAAISAASPGPTGATGATGSAGATGAKDSSVASRGGGGGGHGGNFHGGGGEFRGGEGRDNWNRGDHNVNQEARQLENRGQWDRDHGVIENGGIEELYPVAAPIYDGGYGDPVDPSYYDDSNQIFNENNNGQY